MAKKQLSLKEWLNTPCDVEDLLRLPENQGGGYYMPIVTVRKKLHYMRVHFNAHINFSDFTHLLFNSVDKKTYASGSINVTIYHSDFPFPQSLIGASTYNVARFNMRLEDKEIENQHYANTIKSFTIINALQTEYPQFGSGINDYEIVPVTQLEKIKPMPDFMILKKMDVAKKENDTTTIESLLKNYNFDGI